MSSGELITIVSLSYLGFFLVFFIPWELIQLARRRAGNASARTFTQYTTKRAREGSRFYQAVIVVLPLFLVILGTWLVFHLESGCIVLGIEKLCDLPI